MRNGSLDPIVDIRDGSEVDVTAALGRRPICLRKRTFRPPASSVCYVPRVVIHGRCGGHSNCTRNLGIEFCRACKWPPGQRNARNRASGIVKGDRRNLEPAALPECFSAELGCTFERRPLSNKVQSHLRGDKDREWKIEAVLDCSRSPELSVCAERSLGIGKEYCLTLSQLLDAP